jgi:hypothetical protein
VDLGVELATAAVRSEGTSLLAFFQDCFGTVERRPREKAKVSVMIQWMH